MPQGGRGYAATLCVPGRLADTKPRDGPRYGLPKCLHNAGFASYSVDRGDCPAPLAPT